MATPLFLYHRLRRGLKYKRLGAGCNFYTFSSANPDLLSFDAPFIGNIKLIAKSTSTDGIHPDILAGLQGTFIPDEWMQYEADVTAIGNIVDATFNGVVGRFALDDVWFSVDMGAPATRLAYRFDGVNDSITIPSFSWNSSEDFAVCFDLIVDSAPASQQVIIGRANSDNFFIKVDPDGTVVVRDFSGDRLRSTSSVIGGEIFKIRIERVGGSLAILVNDTQEDVSGFGFAESLSVIGRNVFGLNFSGFIFNVEFDRNGLVERLYKIDDGFSLNPAIVDSVGGFNGTQANGKEAGWQLIIVDEVA